MPETTSRWQAMPDQDLADRVRETRAALTRLFADAELARQDHVAGLEKGSAVCAWNHFENIPTFYNWNNRPR